MKLFQRGRLAGEVFLECKADCSDAGETLAGIGEDMVGHFGNVMDIDSTGLPPLESPLAALIPLRKFGDGGLLGCGWHG